MPKTTVAELTVDELRELIREVVTETIAEMLADPTPDWNCGRKSERR